MQYGYKYIAGQIREMILNGGYPVGTLLPPERSFCEKWGVQRTTLRHALSLLEEEGLIEKQNGIGSVVKRQEVSTVPLISFIVDSGTNKSGVFRHHFLTPVYNALSEQCACSGYRSVCMSIAGADCEKTFDAMLQSSRAVVLADKIPPYMLRRVRELGKPCVLVSERAAGFRSIVCDNDNGLLLAVEHLAALGHKKIAYIGGDRVFMNSRARVDGFRRATMHILGDEKPEIRYCGWSVMNGFDAMNELFAKDSGITAVCTVNDHVALGAYRAAASRNIKIPEDFSIVGFGDTVDEELSQISLTTVRVPYDRFARELWRSLLLEIEQPYENPATVLVESELVVRATSGKCKM